MTSDNQCPHCGMDVTEYARIEKNDAEFFRKFRKVIKVLFIALVSYLAVIILLTYLGYL